MARATAELPRPQVEVSTATTPRFDAVDTATRSSRLGVTLLPLRRSAGAITRRSLGNHWGDTLANFLACYASFPTRGDCLWCASDVCACRWRVWFDDSGFG